MNQQILDQVLRAILSRGCDVLPSRLLSDATELQALAKVRDRVAAKPADAFPMHNAQIATAYRISLAKAVSSGLARLSWGEQCTRLDKLLAASRSFVPPVPEVTAYAVGQYVPGKERPRLRNPVRTLPRRVVCRPPANDGSDE